jgi:ankyrin repeat protein
MNHARKKYLYTEVMMTLLYKYGANIEIKDKKNNKTALTYAIENNNKKLIDLLLRFRSKNVSDQIEIITIPEKDPADEYGKKYSDSLRRKKKKLNLSWNFRKLTL